jgi:hypothetical protein
MNTKQNSKIEKIKRVSTIVKTICRILQILTVLCLTAAVTLLLAFGNVEASIPLFIAYPLFALFIGILPGYLIVKALQHLHRIFSSMALGRIYTGENVSQIKKLSITFLWISAFQFLMRIISSAAAELSYSCEMAEASSSGNWAMSTSGGNAFLSTFFCGITIWLLAWIMDVGRELREENDLMI